MADIVALLEARAHLEQLGDRADRQQRRNEDATTNAPMSVSAMMRTRSRGERLVTKVSPVSTIAPSANWPQAARENDSRRPAISTSSTDRRAPCPRGGR